MKDYLRIRLFFIQKIIHIVGQSTIIALQEIINKRLGSFNSCIKAARNIADKITVMPNFIILFGFLTNAAIKIISPSFIT